jgi:hypothetical protein
MTIQPVRLSLWHLWDMEADADGLDSDRATDRATDRDITGVTESAVGLSGPEGVRPEVLRPDLRPDLRPEALNNRFDLFVDWPIPEAGFMPGRLGDRSGDRSGDRLMERTATPLDWVESRGDRGAIVEAAPSESPDLPEIDALPGVQEFAQELRTIVSTVSRRSIESLRQFPSVVQSLQDPVQDQSRQAISVYGATVLDWTDRLATHPLSKPALLLALPWGTAAVAFQALAGVPGQGACAFNPLPLSDLDQLHCAREQMRSQDPTAVIQGFRHLSRWSKDQMLYPVAERQLQSWAAVLLGLARHQFDQGHWQDAEALLAEIPESSPLHGEAQSQRTDWLRVQRQGEDLLAQAHQAIAAQRWQSARLYAQQLSGLSNDYWRRQGLETLPGQIDRQANLPQSPATPLALGSMPWIPVRGAQPEFSPEISPKGAIA